MAREVKFTCDICGKQTEKIVGKLNFIPAITGVSRITHSNYSDHADVGVCCKERLFRSINFRKRLPWEEYQRRRKLGAA